MVRGAFYILAFALVAGAFVFFAGSREEHVPPQASVASTTTPMNIASTTSTSKPTSPPSGTAPFVQTPTPQNTGWKNAIATVFWVGEGATDDNGYIQNAESAWDGDWQTHFGGLDDPDQRCDFLPCGFAPKENPFYVALPYNDLDDNGDQKMDARLIPWFAGKAEKSILKNRWVEISRGGKSCFGQWEDVGPFHEDDVAYVFGTAQIPKNTMGEKAGIDLSPALATCLGVDGSDEVMWRHVSASNVPAGPWKEVITTRASQ